MFSYQQRNEIEILTTLLMVYTANKSQALFGWTGFIY